jgi:predicted nuclease of restriction endonuclease-like (RecB) superfamily
LSESITGYCDQRNMYYMKLESLIEQIELVDNELRSEASKAVNRMLTIRNWLIGYYIVEFEQNGEDRAVYGTKLLSSLAISLKNIKGLDERNLRYIRQFYQYYSYIGNTIWGTLSPVLQNHLIRGTVTPELERNTQNPIQRTASGELENKQIPPKILLNKLAFSHFVELIKINEPQKRLFFEIECIKGTWSVRELKRQIDSLYYERSGISKSPGVLSERTIAKTNAQPSTSLIKDIYAFEFLGLPVKDAVEESDLESALLDHLREFILELGNGFCLEARQKRILIGDEYFFIDLVFYHRILKCHVLVELKVEEFSHANAGQLNTYLNYFKQEIKLDGDNDPVGILLVTHKNEALVQYATAGMNQNLFVSKYLLQLPAAKQLEDFINQELKSL